MKRILIIVFLLVLNFTLKAQILQQPNTYGIGWKRTGADTLLYIPSDTLSVPSWGVGKTHIARKGTTLYYWDGSKWSAISGSGSTYTAGNGLTLNGSAFELGGTLNKNTTITTTGYDFNLVGIPTTSSTTGKKVALIDTATGKVERIDPASLSTNIYNTDGTLTGSRTVQLDGNTLGFQGSGAEDFSIQNVGAYSLNNVNGSIVLQNTNDSIKLQPFNGNLVIGTLKTTTSTTGRKILLHDTATGKVERIDPASLGGSPAGSTKQFQYNNAGAFAGSSMLTQETDQILITGNSAASTPPFEVNAHEDLTAEIVNVKQSGTKKFSFHSNGSIEMAETTDPTAAATGYNRLYAQAGKLYTHNDDGRVAQVIQNLQLVFGAGSGADSDTTAFTTSAIYGSFYNDADTIVVTSMRSVLQGTSPDVTYKVWYNDSLNVEAGATALVTAGSQVTNTTTGTNVTSFDVTKIPPGVWVWVKTSTVATKPKYFSLTVNGYRK